MAIHAQIILVDIQFLYQEKKEHNRNNANMIILGTSGSGKSTAAKLLLRTHIRNSHQLVVIDPEGEYKNLTKTMGGAYIKLAPNVATGINPFDVEEEFDPDLKIMRVDLKSKIADNLNLIAVMVGGAVLTEEYAEMIGADYYGKDAMSSVRIAEKFFLN